MDCNKTIIFGKGRNLENLLMENQEIDIVEQRKTDHSLMEYGSRVCVKNERLKTTSYRSGKNKLYS